MILPVYRAQVDLLLQVLPYVAKEEIFALKGGTAINLFIRAMPRLSVDIDLTYLPLDPRADALQNIQNGLRKIKADLEKKLPEVKINTVPLNGGTDVKLNCQGQGAQIKIEVNTITRGNVFPTKLMQVVDSVQDEFDKFAAINVVSMAELYGGKICAGIDRQHPRDVFDVKLLLKNEGFTNEIWEGFKIGLISHYKPISELLSPVLKDQKLAFDNQFAGMTSVEFTYEDYEETRAVLINTIGKRLTDQDKKFIISFELGEPDWELFPIPVLKNLPAIQWKLININKLKKANAKKHEQMIENLRAILN
ncbi:nucleotidyl transferase AbiEii/AbiGii toxin family protein [Labilibaculum sp. K2S]|uniref:nucleotidyl transferase AbiEii/AbiGii toxin family protein n=1 Tax=Labilibaculum sp. K2S TaxID=3056386 RepID=UPI0025A406E1|nr:nucleotidyl transferase AbiEii/AbiGii toxin family protein [Labilibaculum sp. K2S]MDM8161478.1 nucleotidyl transferase AbiEii/AbiGii toxin family protein [Labilibaculum sp. K2S]